MDGVRDVTRNQPVRVVVRKPIHQAPRHLQQDLVIDFDDEADDFYEGQNQYDIPDQRFTIRGDIR